ncbi:cysteine-rich KTR domain-containing protein [Lachnospiraceae bacterium 47-T17]
MGVAGNAGWLLCPACGNKTRLKIREDTELKNFPLYCPKCKQETWKVVSG